MKHKLKYLFLPLTLSLSLFLCACSTSALPSGQDDLYAQNYQTLSEIPEFSEEPYVILNDNMPNFDEDDLTTNAFETYSALDDLGRCGVAYANICEELMPTEKRGNISSVYPSGWEQNQYDFVDGKSLYNRCHLIGWQLAGEDANEKNLITGTRYMNTKGMLPFEDEVDDYVEETGNHVLYRVTPIYDGDNLVASGVQMEALSVEDKGEGVCFNIYCYNNEPGVTIDYATGENWLSTDGDAEQVSSQSKPKVTKYVLNIKSHKFHDPDCGSVSTISEQNKKVTKETRQQLIDRGYEPCGVCKP